MVAAQLKVEAQEALDELTQEGSIGIVFFVEKVESVPDYPGYYEIEFSDRGRTSLRVFWQPQWGPFKAAVRREILKFLES